MFAFYEGTSLLSRVIRFLCWSKYSHVSWVEVDKEKCMLTGEVEGEEWEAWQPVVSHVSRFGTNHTDGTIVDLYDFVTPLTEDEHKVFIDYLKSKEGTPYDYMGLLMFILRRKQDNGEKKLFCSEYMFYACLRICRYLLNNVNPCQVSPERLSESPLLKKWKTVRVKHAVTGS